MYVRLNSKTSMLYDWKPKHSIRSYILDFIWRSYFFSCT
jgi:hypothetical protein